MELPPEVLFLDWPNPLCTIAGLLHNPVKLFFVVWGYFVYIQVDSCVLIIVALL